MHHIKVATWLCEKLSGVVTAPPAQNSWDRFHFIKSRQKSWCFNEIWKRAKKKKAPLQLSAAKCLYAVFFPWTLNDIANSLGQHREKWHIVVKKFAAIGSECGSSHAKNTSNLFQLIRRTNPSWESLSRLLSCHPRMRESIRVVIGRNEGPATIADTSVFNRPNQTRSQRTSTVEPCARWHGGDRGRRHPTSTTSTTTFCYHCGIRAPQSCNHSLKPASALSLSAHPVTLQVLGEAAETEGCKNRPGRLGCRLDTAGPLNPPPQDGEARGDGLKGVGGNSFEIRVSSFSICDCGPAERLDVLAAPVHGTLHSVPGDETARIHVIHPLSFTGANMNEN